MNACLISTLLKCQILVNFPTEYWRPHPSSDSEKKFNLFLCLRPPNKVAKGNLTSRSHKLKRKARCSSFTYWARFVWRSRCCRRHRRLRRCMLRGFIDVRKESEHVFRKNACHLFTRYICYWRFGSLMNYCVSLETDIWVLRIKKVHCLRKKYIYIFQRNNQRWMNWGKPCSWNNHL